MCLRLYTPEIVRREEHVIFGPTILHGKTLKFEQKGIENYEYYKVVLY